MQMEKDFDILVVVSGKYTIRRFGEEMKKYVLLLPSVIYICVWELDLLYIFLSGGDNENESINCIVGVILFVTFIGGIVCNIMAGIKAVKNTWDVKELLKVNLILKYIQLPVNLCFMAGYAGMIMLSDTFWGADDSYGVKFARCFLLIIICFLVVELLGRMAHSGSLAVAGAVRAKSVGVISKRAAVVCGVVSFVVFVDIIVGHILYKKVKNVAVKNYQEESHG